MGTMGDKPKSKLEEMSKGDKVKREKLILAGTLQKRCWLRPVIFFVKIWCILRGRGPSRATINWLAKYGVKRIIGKVRAGNDEEKGS